MKCFKCGAELSDDAKFCSYCGNKIEKSVSMSDIEQTLENLFEEFETTASAFERSSDEMTNSESSMESKFKQKSVNIWNKLGTYEKITAIAMTVLALFGIIAFLVGKTFATIVVALQIILIVIALLMKRQIIKVSKDWLYIIMLSLAVILLIPYVHLFRNDYENIKRFKWSDIVLADVVPETKSRSGEILINSKGHLSLDIYEISQNQYTDYIETCKEGGFSVDVEQMDNSFIAYKDAGYKLCLDYDINESIMHIDLERVYQYGTLVWPHGTLPDMIPVPKSEVGEITTDDDRSFLVYVANTPIDDFKSYTALCAQRGFNIDAHNTAKAYFAQNSEGFRLSVEYQGNSVICIAVNEPEYDVTIEVKCVANLFFSKYDVEMYVNDVLEKTISNGASEVVNVNLEKGVYEVKFVSAEDEKVTGSASINIQQDEVIKYKISCSSTGIDVENITESNEYNAESQPEEGAESDAEENKLSENELMETESEFEADFVPEEDELDFSWLEYEISNNNNSDTDYDEDAETLDEYGAWEAVQRYGESCYSYFHVHSMDNKLSAEQIDDNTWELKAYCDVDMGDGKSENLTCEATVAGTNLDANVTDFIVY